VHWLNAITPPLEQHLDALVDVVRGVLEGGRAEESTPAAAPAVTAAAPAPASNRGSVPAALTQFIGRESEVTACQESRRQPATRLLTLVGFAGMGKSRSALELATRCVGPDFPEGVWWVEVHEATTSEQMLERIAHVLSLEVDPQKPLRDQVAAR